MMGCTPSSKEELGKGASPVGSRVEPSSKRQRTRGPMMARLEPQGSNPKIRNEDYQDDERKGACVTDYPAYCILKDFLEMEKARMQAKDLAEGKRICEAWRVREDARPAPADLAEEEALGLVDMMDGLFKEDVNQAWEMLPKIIKAKAETEAALKELQTELNDREAEWQTGQSAWEKEELKWRKEKADMTSQATFTRDSLIAAIEAKNQAAAARDAEEAQRVKAENVLGTERKLRVKVQATLKERQEGPGKMEEVHQKRLKTLEASLAHGLQQRDEKHAKEMAAQRAEHWGREQESARLHAAEVKAAELAHKKHAETLDAYHAGRLGDSEKLRTDAWKDYLVVRKERDKLQQGQGTTHEQVATLEQEVQGLRAALKEKSMAHDKIAKELEEEKEDCEEATQDFEKTVVEVVRLRAQLATAMAQRDPLLPTAVQPRTGNQPNGR